MFEFRLVVLKINKLSWFTLSFELTSVIYPSGIYYFLEGTRKLIWLLGVSIDISNIDIN